MADSRTHPLRVNVAIVTAVIAMPLVVAAGFLSGRLAGEGPPPGAPFLPDLRGTVQPDATVAGPARMTIPG